MDNTTLNPTDRTSSPFAHIRPELWKQTKAAHILLVSLGTLHMFPAGLIFYYLYAIMAYEPDYFSRLNGESLFYFVITVTTTCLGTMAWIGLCLLFFQRTDARWQKYCWMLCAAYGCYATITMLIGIFILINESELQHMGWWGILPLIIIFSSFISATCGFRNHRLAKQKMSEPINETLPI